MRRRLVWIQGKAEEPLTGVFITFSSGSPIYGINRKTPFTSNFTPQRVDTLNSILGGVDVFGPVGGMFYPDGSAVLHHHAIYSNDGKAYCGVQTQDKGGVFTGRSLHDEILASINPARPVQPFLYQPFGYNVKNLWNADWYSTWFYVEYIEPDVQNLNYGEYVYAMFDKTGIINLQNDITTESFTWHGLPDTPLDWGVGLAVQYACATWNRTKVIFRESLFTPNWYILYAGGTPQLLTVADPALANFTPEQLLSGFGRTWSADGSKLYIFKAVNQFGRSWILRIEGSEIWLEKALNFDLRFPSGTNQFYPVWFDLFQL